MMKAVADWFSLTECDFSITIKSRWGKLITTIAKGDCFEDSDGRYYFTLTGLANGNYYAYFSGTISDVDFSGSKRTITDKQRLITIGSCCCDCEESDCCCENDHLITYEQVWTRNIDDVDYLCDKFGNYIYTSDGHRIAFTRKPQETTDMGKITLNMTGDEFKQLIEGRSPNGEVDTIPEMVDVMKGINDDSTIKDETESTYDEDNRTLYINGAKPKTNDER